MPSALFNLPNYPGNLPWFMYDTRNFVLITSPTVPGDISDTKQIIFTENPVPGLNYSPVAVGGGGNRKISFTLPLINRNNTVGNTLSRALFENLRNRTYFPDIVGEVEGFRANPKVIYSFGVGIPLPFFVTKCDFLHKGNWVNQLGNSEYTDVSIELTLDETDPLYKAEENFRRLAPFVSQITDLGSNIISQTTGGRPF